MRPLRVQVLRPQSTRPLCFQHRPSSSNFNPSHRQSKRPLPHPRHVSTTAMRQQAPISPNTAATSTPNTSPPPATSKPSSAQPFSTPLSPSPAAANTPTKPAARAKPSPPKSSVPAGTPLKGLNYFKAKQDPLAMEGKDYPEWLWTVLEPKKNKSGADSGQDEIDPRIYSKSARSRQAANKRARLNAKLNPGSGERRVPIYAQSVDLPTGDGSVGGAIEAQEKREELTRAMREKRRKDIKETNFLKGIR